MSQLNLKLGARLKGQFFDAAKIKNKADRARGRAFSKFGAYVRAISKNSIKRRKRASKPGEAPTSWTGLLKRMIFFVVEPIRRSVIVGPAKLNKGTSAPSVLEYGGMTSVPGDPVWKTREGKRVLEPGKLRDVEIKPRPYMGPAFAKGLEKMPASWRDSIK